MKIEGKPFSAFDAAKLPGGLVPAVIQDDRTLQVLMLGYMNREAYEKSLAEGRVTFYSRSRQRLWTKGETSGNWLDIVSVAADCDCDTLLIRVIPHGPTCHTGSKTCFGEAVPETEGFIRYLQSVIRGRHAEMPEGSYTSKLFNRGVNKIAQKVGEELAYHKVEAEQKIPMTNTVTVPRGKEFSLRLSDGTQVWLNSESSLVFPVRFGDGPREVTVTGEAYFDVAHDASRRFVVHADTVSVSVYGTAFNISSYADESAIETTLVRGSVEVRSGHRRAMLQPGQQARVGREGAIFDVRQVAAEDYAAWTRGLFTFNDETIASICRKLSRWYGVEIVPRGVDADKVRYTGVVKRYETFAEMARLLARTDQIRADVEEGKIVLCIDRDDD